MTHSAPIKTSRLTLIAATLQHLTTELNEPQKLGDLLSAEISTAWPPGEYDRDAMEFFHARLEEGGQAVEGWYGWYALKKATLHETPALIGAGGYFGPPDAEGVVEIGYSVLPEWQRQGYATEIVGALLTRAFENETATKVIAHTMETNPASSGVLLKCGFVATGAGEEPGTVRYEYIG